MDRYSQYSAMILTMLMLSFTIVAHWLACIWYVIAERERTRNEKDWDLGKMEETYIKFHLFYTSIFHLFLPYLSRRMVAHIGRQIEN